MLNKIKTSFLKYIQRLKIKKEERLILKSIKGIVIRINIKKKAFKDFLIKVFNKKTSCSLKMYVYFICTLLIVFLLVTPVFFFKFIKKFETNIKVGFVTDFEYGYKENIGNKLTNKAPEELEKIVNYFNNDFHPDIVIEGGDMVESSMTKRDTTIEQLKKINDIFSKIDARKEYVLGNHDLRNLSKKDIQELLNIESGHKYFDIGEWRFVIMDTNYDKDGGDKGPSFYAGGYVSENEFKWLEEALSTERPMIVFSHHPVIPLKRKNIVNGDKVSVFFEKYNNIVLAVSGHDPDFSFNKQAGIYYLVVDNLANIDSVGSFATLEMKYNKYTRETKINIEHHGPTREHIEIKKRIGRFNFKEVFREFQYLVSQMFHL